MEPTPSRMRDIAFGVVPIRDYAFFEQVDREREVRDRLLESAHLVAQVLHFARGGLARRVAARLRLPASRNSFDQL